VTPMCPVLGELAKRHAAGKIARKQTWRSAVTTARIPAKKQAIQNGLKKTCPFIYIRTSFSLWGWGACRVGRSSLAEDSQKERLAKCNRMAHHKRIASSTTGELKGGQCNVAVITDITKDGADQAKIGFVAIKDENNELWYTYYKKFDGTWKISDLKYRSFDKAVQNAKYELTDNVYKQIESKRKQIEEYGENYGPKR